jgi:hypothetical protein
MARFAVPAVGCSWSPRPSWPRPVRQPPFGCNGLGGAPRAHPSRVAKRSLPRSLGNLRHLGAPTINENCRSRHLITKPQRFSDRRPSPGRQLVRKRPTNRPYLVPELPQAYSPPTRASSCMNAGLHRCASRSRVRHDICNLAPRPAWWHHLQDQHVPGGAATPATAPVGQSRDERGCGRHLAAHLH